MEQAIKRNSTAEIKDADGNVLETLDVDVQVQQLPTGRNSDGVQYLITVTAKSNLVDCPDSESKDGIMAKLHMVCRDELGPDNTLVSVGGSWSGEDSETEGRTVTYYAYNIYNTQTSKVPNKNAPTTFDYYPKDYKGFTFKATSDATITKTNHTLHLEAATDSSVLDK